MSLHIKVFNNFWNHRKTAKLRALIGDDAFWIPPALWSYASENQPDGNFKDYTSEEISMLVAHNKHPSSIKEHLITVGFMDAGGTLHDWAEHNAFHFTFAERAKKAAKTRWDRVRKKKRDEMKGDDKIRDDTSIASSIHQAFDTFWKAYPRKTSKANALKAFPKALDKVTLDKMLSAITEQKKQTQWKKDGYAFVPHPASWLNGERWNDVPVIPPRNFI